MMQRCLKRIIIEYNTQLLNFFLFYIIGLQWLYDTVLMQCLANFIIIILISNNIFSDLDPTCYIYVIKIATLYCVCFISIDIQITI